MGGNPPVDHKGVSDLSVPDVKVGEYGSSGRVSGAVAGGHHVTTRG